jgi:hypothetical protein
VNRQRINRIVRTAISVALLMVSATAVYAQRRGAFIAGPPSAGRPPAVSGTPGAAGSAGFSGSQPCCFGGNRNQGWRGFARGHDRDNNPVILAVPVPVYLGGEPAPEPEPPDDPHMNQLPLELHPDPPSHMLPAASHAPAGSPAPGATPPESAHVLPPPPAPDPPHVLIALTNGWVYFAIAYWADRGTLHYVTAQGDHNQVSLQLVDRKISARLNQDSSFPFVLP